MHSLDSGGVATHLGEDQSIVSHSMAAPQPPGRFLEGTQIEIINEHAPRGGIRCALFDFDGTISLIREGWQQVMVPMMVEILLDCPRRESEDELHAIVSEYVERLTGKQTIYQMIQLAEEVGKRGGTPLDPLEYKRMYLQRLWQRIEGRVEALRSGAADPVDWIVPGLVELLQSLSRRGVTMYLASGTDHEYVESESALLGVARQAKRKREKRRALSHLRPKPTRSAPPRRARARYAPG